MSSLLPTPPGAMARDDTSTVKQELENYYKRIADLETRIHDLALQNSVVSCCGSGGLYTIYTLRTAGRRLCISHRDRYQATVQTIIVEDRSSLTLEVHVGEYLNIHLQ